MAQNKGRGHQQTAPRAGSPGDQDSAVPGCCWHLELMHLGTALPSWLFGRKTLLQQAARPALLRVVARDVEGPRGMSWARGAIPQPRPPLAACFPPALAPGRKSAAPAASSLPKQRDPGANPFLVVFLGRFSFPLIN